MFSVFADGVRVAYAPRFDTEREAWLWANSVGEHGGWDGGERIEVARVEAVEAVESSPNGVIFHSVESSKRYFAEVQRLEQELEILRGMISGAIV